MNHWPCSILHFFFFFFFSRTYAHTRRREREKRSLSAYDASVYTFLDLSTYIRVRMHESH